MKVALYCRVSSDMQEASGLGLKAQTDALRAIATVKGWTVAMEVAETGSGGSLNRPKLQEILEAMERGEIEALAVSHLSRASRSVVDFGTLLQRIDSCGGQFIALDLGVDTSTSGGRLVANVLMSVSEWERSVIGERTAAALAQLPRGKRGGGHHGAAYSDAVVNRCKALRAEGHSIRGIGHLLTAEGVQTLSGASTFNPRTIARLLRTEL